MTAQEHIRLILATLADAGCRYWEAELAFLDRAAARGSRDRLLQEKRARARRSYVEALSERDAFADLGPLEAA